jgi:hypothetical protein
MTSREPPEGGASIRSVSAEVSRPLDGWDDGVLGVTGGAELDDRLDDWAVVGACEVSSAGVHAAAMRDTTRARATKLTQPG